MKINALCILTLLTLFSAQLSGQTGREPKFNWAKGIGGSSIDHCRDHVTDAEGNIYFAGAFQGAVTFQLPGGPVVLNVPARYEDMLIGKADSLGNLIWVRQFGGDDHDKALSVAIDHAGHIYVSGYFSSAIDFGSGISIETDRAVNGFLVQMDTSGLVKWARHIKSNSALHVTDVYVDAQHEAVITGAFMDSVEVAGIAGTKLRSGTSRVQTYLIKFDMQGSTKWAVSLGGGSPNGTSGGASLTGDRENNLYLTGIFTNSDLSPRPPAHIRSGTGVFVLKLDANADFIWAKNYNPLGEFGGGIFSIHYDTVTEGIYLSGTFEKRTDFDPGPGTYWLESQGFTEDGYILKLDSSGAFRFVLPVTGFNRIHTYKVTTDSYGRVYNCGSFVEDVDLNTGSDTLRFRSTGGADAYLLSVDHEGNFLWGKTFGGENNEYPYSITVSPDFKLNTSGIFAGNSEFHIDRDSSAVIEGWGNHDIFLHQLALPYCQSRFPEINSEANRLYITEEFDSWIWLLDGDSLTGSEQQQEIYAYENGAYAVALLHNGCPDTSKAFHINNLGITSRSGGITCRIFPNPVQDLLQVESSKPIRLSLYDPGGRLLLQSETDRIHTNALPRGLYLLHVSDRSSGSLLSIHKIVRQ